MEECIKCKGDVYVIGTGGSILSGVNSYWGYCPTCREYIKATSSKFRDLSGSAREIVRMYPNQPIIEKGKHPIFSWGKGLVGEYTPDRVIKEAIKGTDLQTLIEHLRSK